MTYNNFRKIQLTILIILILLIFLKNFQIILMTRNIIEPQVNRRFFSPFIVKIVKNEAKPKKIKEKWSFLPSLSPNWRILAQYIKDRQSQSSSSLIPPIDKEFFLLKRLTSQSFSFIKRELISVKYRYLSWQKSLIKLRSLFLKKLEETAGPRGRPLAEGMIFGDLSSISQDIYHSFKVIGILHLLSASSANFTLFLNFCLFFCQPFCHFLHSTRRFYLYWTIIFLYFSLVGSSASTLRAFLTLSLSFFARFYIKRTQLALHNLVVAAIFMLIINPFYLESLSFQFSFLASFGIIFFYRFLEKDLSINKNILVKNLFLTFCAQFFLFPIMIYNFGEINYLAVPANLLIFPLVEFLTFLFLTVFVFQCCALIFYLPAVEWFLSSLITKTIDIFFSIINFFELSPWKSFVFKNNKELYTSIFILINLLLVFSILLYKNKKYSKYKYRTIS